MAVKTFTTGEVLTASDTNTYLANSGLVYITSTTFTSGSTADIALCLSSTYDNYRIVLSDLRISSANGISFTLITGSGGSVTPAASNWTYATTRFDYGANAWNFAKGTTAAYATDFAVAGTSAAGAVIDLYNPNTAQQTTFQSTGIDYRGTTGYLPYFTGAVLANSTQYTGIRFNIGGSTFTNMKVVVYGYRIA